MGLDNPLHIAFLLVILLLVFGAKRLPEMGRSLGEGLRGFRDSMSGDAHGRTGSIVPDERMGAPAAVAAAEGAPSREERHVLAAATLRAEQDEAARETVAAR